MNIKLKDLAFIQLNDLDTYQLEKTLQSNTTIKLSGEMNALEAADLLKSSQSTAISVTDENGNVQGVIFPWWIQMQLQNVRGVHTNSFSEAISYIKHEGDEEADSPGGIPRYHHEWLNLVRPELIWCDKGEHFIDTETCPYHN